ncbi:MAG: ParB/RepB/Spo0J family partition protein [Caulobacteraceae bacterium]
MAEGRRGLGRGLSALLDEAEAATTPEARRAAGVEEIPIELIQANPDQPRRHFSEAELDELAKSIRQRGVLQPILVRPLLDDAGSYQIVAGERRWRASQKIGLHVVPALVRVLSDTDVMDIAVIENVQRQDLTALEEARAYRKMMDFGSRTADVIGNLIGKSRSHVANTVRLLSLPPSVLTHMEAGRLTAGHGRALAMAEGEAAALAEEVVRRGLSVRETEARARKIANGPLPPPAKAPPKPARKDADTRALETDLAEILGLDVQLTHRGAGGGELKITYATLEQLDDLCRRLMRG